MNLPALTRASPRVSPGVRGLPGHNPLTELVRELGFEPIELGLEVAGGNVLGLLGL